MSQSPEGNFIMKVESCLIPSPHHYFESRTPADDAGSPDKWSHVCHDPPLGSILRALFPLHSGPAASHSVPSSNPVVRETPQFALWPRALELFLQKGYGSKERGKQVPCQRSLLSEHCNSRSKPPNLLLETGRARAEAKNLVCRGI